MRLVATRRLEDGATLARDVLTGRSDAIPLLRAGCQITRSYQDGLLAEGINAVWIEDELSAGIMPNPVVSDETRREATRTVAYALEAARQELTGAVVLPDRALRELERVTEMILADIEACGDVALALLDLSAASNYTMQHSIDVAALGLVIGRRLFRERGWLNYRGDRSFERIDHRLSLLGVGLLVHDIGKLTIPADILDKPGKLDPHEWDLIRMHPVAGVEMLQSDLISPLVRVVVRSHHERVDGGGYPDGLAGDEINELALIASVADVYDAVTSERAYAPAQPPHVGVRVIVEGSGSAFDPTVVDVFKRLVAPYPPGVEIRLADGRRGVVVDVREGALDRPLVRIGWDARGRRIHPYELQIEDPRREIAAAVDRRSSARDRRDPPPPGLTVGGNVRLTEVSSG
jgi:HD-GYP domain-containing protein (c-di-GMP phosphodiesterase class II)